MKNAKLQPWHQQEGERNAAYARFLLYLHLGCDRSIYKAYLLHLAESGNAKGKNKRTAPGSWCRESKQWQWLERATSYDIYVRQKNFRIRDVSAVEKRRREKELEALVDRMIDRKGMVKSMFTENERNLLAIFGFDGEGNPIEDVSGDGVGYVRR